MNDPILFTPHDLWNVFLAICGAITATAAAFVVILKVVDYFRKPNRDQNIRITKLEERVDLIDERLEDGNKHFETHDTQMKDLESSMKKSNRLVIESLKVLIEHDVDGDNVESLKQMNHRIDKYLLEK